MKQEFSPEFLYVNTLFKTTEYKLDSNNNIHINEISNSGYHRRIISLDTIEVATSSVDTSNTFPKIVFLMGSVAAITFGFFSSKYNIVALDLLSLISILTTLLASFLIIAIPVKNHIYVDSFTNKTLFSIRKNHRNQYQLDDFIKLLDQNISKAKNNNISDTNITDFSHKQRTLNMNHLDSLYNLGFIDEITYKRISNNINNNLLDNKDHRPLADVIYL